MQLDSEMAAVVGCGVGIFSSVATAFIAYGVLREKVRTLEKRTDEREKKEERDSEHYVTYKHFDAIIPQLQAMISEMQKDIKKLIVLVRHSGNNGSDPN